MDTLPLFHCVKQDYKKVAYELVAQGCSVNARNSHGQTALHCCATAGTSEMAHLLSDLGAYVNATDNEGNTSVHYAV